MLGCLEAVLLIASKDTRSLGDSNPCFRRERARLSYLMCSPHSLEHVLHRAFHSRELLTGAPGFRIVNIIEGGRPLDHAGDAR